MKHLLGRPSPAMVVALMALFVSLGGVTFAAVSLTANSVGTQQLKRGAVHKSDIFRRAVTNSKLRANAVTGDKVADDSLGGADILESSLGTVPSATTATSVGPNGVNTGAIQDDAVTSAKVLDNSLTGGDIDESTLGQVPDAAALGGKPGSAFMGSSTHRNESAVGPGIDQGDGTFVILESCDTGVLLSGGPANVNATSDMVESFPNNAGGWSARIDKNAAADNFSVVVICADQ
jgi:hypothetical protein